MLYLAWQLQIIISNLFNYMGVNTFNKNGSIDKLTLYLELVKN